MQQQQSSPDVKQDGTWITKTNTLQGAGVGQVQLTVSDEGMRKEKRCFTQ